jgi:hypothetical protein
MQDTQAKAAVGRFVDERGEASNYLGVVRNGYYIPQQIIKTEMAVSDVVESVFIDAMRSRNFLDQKAKVMVEGKILKWDVEVFAMREVNAKLRISVLTLPNRTILFANNYETHKKEFPGITGGVFQGTDVLHKMAETALNETIDKVLADPGFVNAIREE